MCYNCPITYPIQQLDFYMLKSECFEEVDYQKRLVDPLEFTLLDQIYATGKPISENIRLTYRERKPSEDKPTNRGHWSDEENRKYHLFLQAHHQHFVNRHMRRMDKIFKTMEIFVGTRIAEQCRSHHQKMEKKYRSFSSIIANLRELHYRSVDSQTIAEELANQGVQAADGVASISELSQKEQQSAVEPKQKKKAIKKNETISKLLPPTQTAIDPMVKQEYKQYAEHVNMLEQSQQLVDAQFYQVKEQNSSILYNMLH